MTIAHYVKTDAGREAIRDRVHPLSRPTRNLLLVIDSSKPGIDWVALVGGSTNRDLAQLLQAGLIADAANAAPLPLPLPLPQLEAQTQAAGGRSLQDALAALSYRDLYDWLTKEARARLGLIKGYRMVLEIEKCAGAEEIRRLTQRFVEQVRATQGDDAARAMCRNLGADL